MAGKPGETLSWLDAEQLNLLFIDELRFAGYNIGVGEYIAAQELVLALLGRGVDLSNAQRLKGYLGPLLCSTAAEQEDFSVRYDRWVERIGYSSTPRALPP